jgi:APA family basic amino acid/polyamine antiporter
VLGIPQAILAAEMPRAAARDGLFPARFNRLSRRGVPAVGILASGVLASALVLVSYIGEAGITVFNTLILMNGIAAAIPYGFSALAQIKWRIADRRAIATSRFVKDLPVAVVSVIFSVLFVVYSTDTEASGFAVYLPFVYLLGILIIAVPVYLANRARMSEPEGAPPAEAISTDASR